MDPRSESKAVTAQTPEIAIAGSGGLDAGQYVEDNKSIVHKGLLTSPTTAYQWKNIRTEDYVPK
jgi:hypothetical protein